MDTTKHNINTLFKQLGLASSESEIDTFIAAHSLPDTTLLQDAPFWDQAQRHFIAESLAEDGDWSEVIDELDVRLRQQ
ncbi:DUF2789 domain-containing protein [Pseudoalteromonas sp. KG3]|uniref:DUF2789 domain-containing protein n=1 Tax=Pseudoalteromonas prydzensis TaxID=182141 RepID=A0ABR9FLH8_9GAMM|nr:MULTISPECIES: DUF2789 domain-containing protein [Pseudoalteromonas]MBE0457685.1 DUF2789 domain-containing protein [Pseudoalteromonas prydzensis]WKD23563.1 DUF2789 domain-containing protein [Pseudoalteromonas sp. KG3]